MPRRIVRKTPKKQIVRRRVVLPKIGTVCLEGYKISKSGNCIKDKKYVKKVVKRVVIPKAATVCLEGYKISKAGRCIKDKKYKTIIQSVPMQLRESNSVSFGMMGPKRYVKSVRASSIPEAPLRPKSGFTVRAPMGGSLVQQMKAQLEGKKAVISLENASKSPSVKASMKAVADVVAAVPALTKSSVKAILETPMITQKDVQDLGKAIQASTGGKPVSKKVAEATGAAFVEAAVTANIDKSRKTSIKIQSPVTKHSKSGNILDQIKSGIVLKKAQPVVRSDISSPLDPLVRAKQKRDSVKISRKMSEKIRPDSEWE